MNLLQDTFTYFAKYPATAAVEKFFNRTNGSLEYNDLRQAIDNLSENNLLPEITDYIFGVNEESVKKRIASVRGIYLFVDYGNISSETNAKEVKYDRFQLAVTLAKPTAAASFDQAEELLMSDKLLSQLCRIRTDMREDRNDPYVKRLIFPNEITPFFARELSNSYGWTLMFQMQGVDMV